MTAGFENRCAKKKESKVPNYRVFRISTLGIVNMVLGMHLIVAYLDA